MATLPVPLCLRNRPFTIAEARDAGISLDVLLGPSYRKLLRGVYIAIDVELTLIIWLRAVLLVAPCDAVISHLTALRLYGFTVGDERPFHLSTRTATHSSHKLITAHRRRAPISVRHLSGIPVTGPDRTLIDVATKITVVELIQAAEVMINKGFTTLDRLADYAIKSHLDGVLRTRRLLPLIREGSESPMETLVRLMLVFARLPEPMCNINIRDARGRFLARGDLVYSEYLIVVEYDGLHHERSAKQRQRDITRRERLEAAGWRVIVITSGDLTAKPEIVRRVHDALIERGYTGRAPQLNAMWTTWFK